MNHTKKKPSYLGAPVLARHDPDGHYEIGNIYFRTAVSEEEARFGLEIHLGAELRDRMLELERQGWVLMTEENRQKLMELE